MKKLHSMSFSKSILFLLHSAMQEIRRRGCSYCLSFFSVLIVVAASAVAQSIIDRAPIIFLQSAEGPSSQTDILFTANTVSLSDISTNSPSFIQSFYSPDTMMQTINMLNLTRVNEVLGPSRAKQTAPRQSITTKLKSCSAENTLFSVYTEPKPIGSTEQQRRVNNMNNAVDSGKCASLYFKGQLSVIDTEREAQMGLGRSYPFPPLKFGEAIISQKQAQQMKVQIGDYIVIEGSFYDYFALYEEYWDYQQTGYSKSTYDANATRIKYQQLQQTTSKMRIPVQIKYLLDQTYGKFSDGATDRLVIIEQGTFFQMLAYWGPYELYTVDMYDADPNQFSDEIRMNLPNRLDVYLNSNYETVQFSVTQYASQVARDLGVYPINMKLPILSELFANRFSQMFLGIILNMIIVILFLLSVFLLYNLLLISVETKTYEMGVLRVLGFNKPGVVFLILTQALSYVLPAILAGMLVSIPLLMITSNMLRNSMGVEIANTPTPNAVGLALGLGFLIPMFSAIVPIKEALKQQLSFALDLNRSKSQAVKIDIDISGQGIPWGRITFALVSAMFGISIYFLLPLALLSFNIGLLLAIFFVLLCSMLFGFVMLTFNFQYLVERLVVAVFFCCAGAATRNIILKNLATHRIKNRRTALMYSLSIAFVIFIVTGMTVQIQNSVYQTIQQHGTYMEVFVPRWSNTYLPVDRYEYLFSTRLAQHVKNHAWITQPLQTFMQSKGYQSVYMTHIGKVYQVAPIVVGVSPSLLDLGFDQFLNVYKRSTDSGLDPIKELYTPRGSQSCILGQAYMNYLQLDTSFNSSLLLVVYNNTFTKYHELRVSSVLNTAPALTFSQIPSVMVQSVVVSLPTYQRMSHNEILSFEQFPMSRLLIQFTDNANVDYVYQVLQEEIQNDPNYWANLWDYRDNAKSLQQNQNLIQIIFSALTAVVMALCFFSLSSSMSANLMEQVKEISVLRAIGNSKRTITLVYIYEAFVLVFSSSLIGLIVGWAIGYTMALQQTLITQLPLVFYLPWQMLIVIFGVAIATAVLSTVFPARRILKHEIAQIMRMN